MLAKSPGLPVREAGEPAKPHPGQGGFRGLRSPSFSWDTEVLHPCAWQCQPLTGDSRHLDGALETEQTGPMLSQIC